MAGAFNRHRTAGRKQPPQRSKGETTMSMLESLGRYGTAIRNAHERSKARRLLNSLPPELQKDIGWPVSPLSSEKAALINTIWSAAR
jgi:hypothetical protein